MLGDPIPPNPPLHEAGDYVAWVLMLVLGVVGLVLASAAQDNEMYLFGWSLCGFATVFLFAELKKHFDLIDKLTHQTTALVELSHG